MKKLVMKIKTCQYWHVFILLLITLIGGFLRFYKLEQFMWIGADSARDTIVAKHMAESRNNYFIQPCTGGSEILKNSPLYYWILAFFWYLIPSPIGISIFLLF